MGRLFFEIYKRNL